MTTIRKDDSTMSTPNPEALAALTAINDEDELEATIAEAWRTRYVTQDVVDLLSRLDEEVLEATIQAARLTVLGGPAAGRARERDAIHRRYRADGFWPPL